MNKEELEEEKLRLEIRRIKRPFILRPEFLGLIIPFLTIFVTYLINKPAIDQALKQREWRIEKDNWEIQKANERLNKEKEKLNLEKDELIQRKQLIGVQIDSLQEQFGLIVDSLNIEINNLNKRRKATLNKLSRKEEELRLKPINDAIVYIKSKSYSFYNVKDYLYLLDTGSNNPNRNLHINILKDSIAATNDLLKKIRLEFYLLRGERDKTEIDSIETLLCSKPENINSSIVSEIANNTGYVGYNFPLQRELQALRFRMLEYVIDNYRKGNIELKYRWAYRSLLPQLIFWKDDNQSPVVVRNNLIVVPFYTMYFKDIENYFESIRICLQMIESPGYGPQDKEYGLSGLAYLNRLVYLAKAYELLSNDNLNGTESASLLQMLPDENSHTSYGPGWDGFENIEVPTTIEINSWEDWATQNTELLSVNSEQNLEELFEQIRDFWQENKTVYQ